MKAITELPRSRSAARQGAILGIVLTFAYGAALFVYAAIRATLIVGAIESDAGRASTIAATVLSLFVACVSLSAALAPISAAAGAVTAAIIRAVLVRSPDTHRPALIGVAVCLGNAALFLVVVHAAVGSPARFASAYVFWLALPLVIFVGAGGFFAQRWADSRSATQRSLLL